MGVWLVEGGATRVDDLKEIGEKQLTSAPRKKVKARGHIATKNNSNFTTKNRT